MSHRVRFLPADTGVQVESGSTLLEAAQAAGLPVASSCGADGMCGKCGLRITKGQAQPPGERELRVTEANRVGPGLRLSCMVVVCGDLTVTADYW